MSKRVIVVLVEGPTDKVALRGNLDHLVTDKTVEFEPTDGDMTTNENLIATADLNEVIVQDVKRLVTKQNDFTFDDILEVVHLIDTDGLYLPPDRVCQKKLPEGTSATEENKHPIYNDDSIEALDVFSERTTLKNKRFAVRDLLEKKTVDFGRGVQKPYSIFYNSCNLEHALHNQRNVSWTQKRVLAKNFARDYYQNNEKFISLFGQLNKAATWDFKESWAYLKDGYHSLERGSNFILYLRKLNPETVDKYARLTH
jgi:hypothetical protein